MKRLVTSACVLVGLWCAGVSSAMAARFEVEQDAEGVTVQLDGQLLARYVTRSGAKPIVWPLVGPHAIEMTRGYPMRPATEHERQDHLHHRSLWFTHGDVNGISFWHEEENHGTTVHREFVEVTGGDQAVIVTRNDWIAPGGEKVCEDLRRLTFGADETGETRWLDFDITLIASNGEVTFGDTKEGTFGVRVAGTMKVDAKMGGRIVNSEGQTDGEAWGKPARWVDYSGPVDGKTVGLAILNHPASFRYPTHWHVRTYGLFAANPFGLHDFVGGDANGRHSLASGESLSLFYRVVLHPGETDPATLEKQFDAYRQQPKAALTDAQ